MKWEYETKQGDTWDVIARDVYGSEMLAGAIQAANPSYLCLLYFPAGMTLTLPEAPPDFSAEPASPWNKRGPLAELPSAVGEIIIESGYFGGNGMGNSGTSTGDHTQLVNRGEADQHPAAAVTYKKRGLDSTLDEMGDSISKLANSCTHHQNTPAAAWVIEHYLGKKFPKIMIIDDAGVQTEGAPDWENASDNVLTIHFAQPLAGKAILTV